MGDAIKITCDDVGNITFEPTSYRTTGEGSVEWYSDSCYFRVSFNRGTPFTTLSSVVGGPRQSVTMNFAANPAKKSYHYTAIVLRAMSNGDVRMPPQLFGVPGCPEIIVGP